MVKLPPVGGNHISGNRNMGCIFKFSHNLTAGESCLRSAGVLHIGQDMAHAPAQADGLCKAPGPVRVYIDAPVWEVFL